MKLIGRLKLKIGVVLIPMVLLTSCWSYEEVSLQRIVSMEIKNFTLKGIEVAVEMEINNPNNYKITLLDADVNLIINQKDLGKANVQNKVVLAKRSIEKYIVHIKKDFDNMNALMSLGSSYLSGGAQNFVINAKGNIKAKAFMISKRFDVDVTERVRF